MTILAIVKASEPRAELPVFCGSPHPTKAFTCRRLVGHCGDHNAYTFSVRTPETWPASQELDDPDVPGTTA